MNTNNKPHVRPGILGYECTGRGVTGHGMSVAAAYASWEQRFIRQQVEQHGADVCWSLDLFAGVARPFDPTPL